jgi:hypothetical protein
MPHLIQPGTGEHSTYRSAAGLRDQADNQPDEGLEGGSGKAKHGRNSARRAASEHGAVGPGSIDGSLSQGDISTVDAFLFTLQDL